MNVNLDLIDQPLIGY